MMQVFTHPTDPAFRGYRPGSVFYGTQIGNLLPRSSYASYDLVEAARSLLAAALQGEALMTFLLQSNCRTQQLQCQGQALLALGWCGADITF